MREMADSDVGGKIEFAITPRRWLSLFIFFGSAFNIAFQWISLVTWTAQLFMVMFCVLVLPVIWWLNTASPRTALLYAAGLTFVAAAVKCFVGPNLFVVSFIGHFIASLPNIILLVLPGVISAVWFPISELAVASAIATGSFALGNALGYYLPPLIIRGPVNAYGTTSYPSDWSNPNRTESEEALEEVGHQILWVFLGQLVVAGMFLLLTIFAFPAQPVHAPSVAEAKKRLNLPLTLTINQTAKLYGQSIKSLITNIRWVLLTLSGGLGTGTFFTLSTLLNQIIKPTFSDQSDQNALNKEIGQMSLCMMLAGFAGSTILGIILDVTKKFKLIAIANASVYCGMYILFTVFVLEGLKLRNDLVWLDYVLLAIIGACCSATFNLILQYEIELTYPESITIMAGVNALFQQLCGVILTSIGQAIISANEEEPTRGSTLTNIMFCVALVVSILLQLFVKEDLRRQRAEGTANNGMENTADKTAL